ncbi:MAG: tetratricopeptide repeat protein, partial [Verrucomicrobiota bacterium]
MKRSSRIRIGSWVAGTVVMASLLLPPPCRAVEGFDLRAAEAEANSGNAKACYSLGKRYLKGEGVPRDHDRAAEYIKRAAEKGLAFAQNDLASFYARGLGVPRDYELAVKWYLKAAENGDSLAQYSLGRVFQMGRGLPLDLNKALVWFKKAASRNQPEAMVALGQLLISGGEGVQTDYRMAGKWLKKAARGGRMDALNSLGFIYETGGHGIHQDLRRANGCYSKAAQAGEPIAQMNLGRMFRDGQGCKTDLVEACKWFLLAAQTGDGAAQHYLNELQGANANGVVLVGAAEMAEASRRASSFIPRTTALKGPAAPRNPSRRSELNIRT